MPTVRYLTYSMFHNKKPVVGSTFIRVNQLMKYWPQAALYKYGENPDALIFQKVYSAYDYPFPLHFEGIKILDICDPDWLEGLDVAAMSKAMDAITVPGKALADFMQQLTPAPVYIVPDRFDIDILEPIKPHTEKAQTVVWFGYRHNADTLQPAIKTINELGLNLLLISNDDPIIHRFDSRNPKEYYTFKKYSEEEINNDLRRADFAILPGDFRPQSRFKSNNKTIKCILNGLPVAKDGEQLREYIDPKNRQKFIDKNYATIKEQYDVRKSVEQMKEIIGKVSASS